VFPEILVPTALAFHHCPELRNVAIGEIILRQRPILVSASEISLQSLRFTILGNDGTPARSEPISLKTLPDPPLNVGPSDTLRVTFSITDKSSSKGIQPHQNFIRFYDPLTKEEGIHPLKVNSAGKVKFDLNMAKTSAWLPPSTDAPLDVSLIIGSFKYQPIHQPLFKIILPPSAPAPTTPDAVLYSAQPEIQHTFRPEAKIPMKGISAIFALATLAPWVVLLGLWLQIPHRTPKLFSHQIFPFVALLAALEAFIVTYWVSLKLPQLFTYGAALSLLTAIAGKRALTAISGWRNH